jgi:N-dimethylarginine dimethylaminohydrolase
VTTVPLPFGAQSMVAPLRHELVKAPGTAFAAAYDDPAHGFHHAVSLATARREHARLVELLGQLGATVHELGTESAGPDLVYQFDASLVTERGVVLLRSGKPTRRGEEDLQAAWFTAHDIPIVGRIEAPGTVDGGDVCWVRLDVVYVGRSLRTNQRGIDQLTSLLQRSTRVGRRRRCPHLPRHRDLLERQWWAHVPDPADPSLLSAPVS